MAEVVPSNKGVKEVGEQNFYNEVETSVDHCLITWTLHEVILQKISQVSDQLIFSPPCSINSEKWNIFIKGTDIFSDSNAMEIGLFRNIDGNESCAIDVIYRIGIKNVVTEWFEEKRKTNFSLGDSDSIKCHLALNFGSESSLAENSLTVFCEMYIIYTTVTERPLRNQTRESLDLFYLSKDLLHLNHKPYDADVEIRGKNLVRIYAHKSILSARSPTFARMLKNKSSIIHIPEEDYKHIRNILEYIYSGQINFLSVDGVSIGLFECAQRYKIKGLIYMLEPIEICLYSMLDNFTVNFIWEIDVKEIKHCKYITSPPFHATFKESPVWYVEMCPNVNNATLDSIGIYLKPNDWRLVLNIDICVTILDEHNHECYKKYTCQQLNNDGKYGFPNYIDGKDLYEKGFLTREKLTLHCQIIHDVLIEHFEKMDINSPSFLEAYPHLEELSSDFSKLLHNAYFSDATLVVGDEMFNVHKAILCTRSAIFALLFKAAAVDENIIGISDVSAVVLNEMVSYAYSGKFRNLGKDFIIDLYSAAKAYSMISLSSSCTSILVESIDRIYCDICLLAYRYNDEKLIDACLTFLKKNGREMVKSLNGSALMKLEKGLLKVSENTKTFHL